MNAPIVLYKASTSGLICSSFLGFKERDRRRVAADNAIFAPYGYYGNYKSLGSNQARFSATTPASNRQLSVRVHAFPNYRAQGPSRLLLVSQRILKRLRRTVASSRLIQ